MNMDPQIRAAISALSSTPEFNSHESRPPVLPFLKWAGGKRWLSPLGEYLRGLPIARYVEPFLGSGAMFFSVRPKSAILSDTNRALVECYQAIKVDWQLVQAHLAAHGRRHCAKYYYATRDGVDLDQFARAATFIYLNRVCWNGLYRVNRKGKFNVPLGTKDSVLLNSDDFRAISSNLRGATLRASDFEATVDAASDRDLVFADPPYTVRHKFNGFTKYNEVLFSWSDQIRLRDALSRATRRGATVICTNADHASIRELYADKFTISELSRYSSISSLASSRGRFSELLIVGNRRR